jgi:hypothetical protein
MLPASKADARAIFIIVLFMIISPILNSKKIE